MSKHAQKQHKDARYIYKDSSTGCVCSTWKQYDNIHTPKQKAYQHSSSSITDIQHNRRRHTCFPRYQRGCSLILDHLNTHWPPESVVDPITKINKSCQTYFVSHTRQQSRHTAWKKRDRGGLSVMGCSRHASLGALWLHGCVIVFMIRNKTIITLIGSHLCCFDRSRDCRSCQNSLFCMYF